MFLEMITPDKNVYTGEVTLIQLPGVDGLFEILDNHAPMISVLGPGKIKLKEKNQSEEKFFDIKGGVVEVTKNRVIVLAE